MPSFPNNLPLHLSCSIRQPFPLLSYFILLIPSHIHRTLHPSPRRFFPTVSQRRLNNSCLLPEMNHVSIAGSTCSSPSDAAVFLHAPSYRCSVPITSFCYHGQNNSHVRGSFSNPGRAQHCARPNDKRKNLTKGEGGCAEAIKSPSHLNMVLVRL